MMHRCYLEAVDRLFCDLMKNDLPFGGKIILLGGDFRQTLPVLPKKRRAEIVDATLRRSPLWARVTEFKLTINERVRRRGDSAEFRNFAEFVLQLGDGSINDANQLVQIPPNLIHHGTLQDLLLFTQPRFIDGIFDAHNAILTPTNEHANEINSLALQMLGGSTITLHSTDYVQDDNASASALFPVEYLNSINVSGLPPHTLHLREGVPIILLRNINPQQGLCNGTRLRVIAFRASVIQAEVISGPAAGKKVLIPRIPMCPSQALLPFDMVRRQFPIMLAFAMTINKSQGQTLQKVALYLPQPVFSHGQLYVGTSRTGDPNDLRVMILDRFGEQGSVVVNGVRRFLTKNIVFQEIL
jgi:ATP-dependent DNA helicase PIF1